MPEAYHTRDTEDATPRYNAGSLENYNTTSKKDVVHTVARYSVF
jgi:hypothetical protein